MSETKNIFKWKEILDQGIFCENTYMLFHFKEQKFISISFEDKYNLVVFGVVIFLPLAPLFVEMCGHNTVELFVTEQSLRGDVVAGTVWLNDRLN